VQLQQSVSDLESRGLGLAAISPDPPAVLQEFARRHGITYRLLSDHGSATITRYGIRNEQETGEHAGIPHPGTFVVDARGIVVSRSFEARYQERATAQSLAGGQDRPATAAGKPAAETPHLTVHLSASDAAVAPGTRFSLFVDITPKPKMHVYAPEQEGTIPVSVALRDGAGVRAHAPRFPKPEKYFFAPLKETQLVYSRPFRIVQDVTVALTPDLRERAKTPGAELTIEGTLRYQACDDAICYLPKQVPLSWRVGLRALTPRAPERQGIR
jgi:hypothetical protein